MPYIMQHLRREMDKYNQPPLTSGQLNYKITQLCTEFLGTQPSYDSINEIVGILECAKLEFYRRVAAPYEDKKIQENGDVYT